MKTSVLEKNITFYLCILGIYFISCNGFNYTPPEPDWKKDTILPPITTIGANTSGCLVNGKFWLVTPTRKTSGSYSRGSMSIRLDRSGDGQSSTIIISSLYNIILGPGEYKYNRNLAASYSTLGKLYTTTDDSSNIGKLNVLKVDSINRIISGTFEFNLNNSAIIPNDISVTSGRFDIKY